MCIAKQFLAATQSAYFPTLKYPDIFLVEHSTNEVCIITNDNIAKNYKRGGAEGQREAGGRTTEEGKGRVRIVEEELEW